MYYCGGIVSLPKSRSPFYSLLSSINHATNAQYFYIILNITDKNKSLLITSPKSIPASCQMGKHTSTHILEVIFISLVCLFRKSILCVSITRIVTCVYIGGITLCVLLVTCCLHSTLWLRVHSMSICIFMLMSTSLF